METSKKRKKRDLGQCNGRKEAMGWVSFFILGQLSSNPPFRKWRTSTFHQKAKGHHPRERQSARPHDVADAPLPNLSGKGVVRGHMMCLSHFPRITTNNDAVEWLGAFMDNSYDCTEENATEKNGAWDCWARRENHWAASGSASLESSWGSARSTRRPPFTHDSSSNEPSRRTSRTSWANWMGSSCEPFGLGQVST